MPAVAGKPERNASRPGCRPPFPATIRRFFVASTCVDAFRHTTADTKPTKLTHPMGRSCGRRPGEIVGNCNAAHAGRAAGACSSHRVAIARR